jgi:hypothetical protein
MAEPHLSCYTAVTTELGPEVRLGFLILARNRPGRRRLLEEGRRRQAHRYGSLCCGSRGDGDPCRQTLLGLTGVVLAGLLR